MNRFTILALAALLAGGFFLFARTSLTQEPTSSTSKVEEGDTGVRYAMSCLRLARAELAISREMNLKAQVVSPLKMARLRSNVEVAKTQVEIAKQYKHGSSMPLQVAYAEATAELAEQNLRSARKSRQGNTSSMELARLERLEARAEMARLRAEMWRDESNLASLVDQMQWQIDRLTEEFIELNHKVQTLAREP